MKKLDRIKLLIFSLTLCISSIGADEKPRLKDYAGSVYSQNGEDGIIQKIFEIIGITSRRCLEVGGGDGPYGSNIARLWRECGWKGVLIEADPFRLSTLESSLEGYPNCTLVKSYIEKDESLGLTIDSIVADLGIDETFDLVSIDLDGNDYYIFESLKMHPRVVIVEFNHTIPYYRDVYQQYSEHSWEIGCSVAALKRLGKEKGYELVALTLCNAIFVDAFYAEEFKDFETSLEKMFDTQYLKNIILTYSGDPIVVAKMNYLSDGFFKIGYDKDMNCHDCYILKINEIDLNDDDLAKNFPGFPKYKPK